MTSRRSEMPWASIRLVMVSAVMAGLSACSSSTAECDPAQAGFFSGIAGGASGCYDQRIKERQGQLAATQATSDALRAEAERNQALSDQQQAEIASLETQLASLDTNLTKLNDRLKAAKTKANVNRRRLADLEQQAATLKKERSAFTIQQTTPAAVTNDEDKIAAMNQRSKQIWLELDALVGTGPQLE